MSSTNNYNLNIPTGSDKVNILTQITPNFETIDGIMKANEDAGIQVATELFSNKIHALTRTKADAPAMRFTATSNYTAGDTFTVDGVQVTALAPNGSTLPDNAYVIGCEVFAILKGTRLTVWAGIRATDSDKFNGKPASFYATKSEVDNANNLAEGAATLAQNALDKTKPKEFSTAQVVGKFNGKNIYKRILTGTTANQIGYGGYTTSGVPNIDKLVSFNISCKGNSTIIPNYSTDSYYLTGFINSTGEGVVLTNDPDLLNKPFTMCIEYTLTTD